MKNVNWKTVRLMLKLQTTNKPCGYGACEDCCISCRNLEECYNLWLKNKKRKCPTGENFERWCSAVKEMLDKMLHNSGGLIAHEED